MTRAGMAIAVLALASSAGASAAEPLRFVPPAGWTVDADKAAAVHAELYATDTRTQPAATMIGLRMAKAMIADEPFVSGFLAGARKQAPTMVEVRHDFVDISGAHAVRIIADVTVDGEPARQAYYVMPAGADTAMLLVSDARDAFDGRLLEFDEIARATRGLAPSTHAESDYDRGYRVGLIVGRIIGVLLLLGALVFASRAISRRLNKPRG